MLVAGSVWGFVNGRQQAACATEVCEMSATAEPVDVKRRTVNGAALAVATAGGFYGLYKTESMAGRDK